MSDPFVEKLNEKNLCTWYVLPLLGLNPEVFGLSNFDNAYLIKHENLIAVKVIDAQLAIVANYSDYYKALICGKTHDYLVFEIPDKWLEDLQIFLAGKYSQFSEGAKQMIKTSSSLTYEVLDENQIPHTDAILMALDNRSELRAAWMEILQVQEIHLPDELLSPPAESSFINLQNIQ